ncbi:hypothetical protein [Flexithrix dorotheae]|uniref:hypothetical protein n=1 Tax=Flexithrix dorotheae TaxID=70993 RepID=UPI000365655C|nr:hypothetical protein [Flexithrix dorotheae]
MKNKSDNRSFDELLKNRLHDLEGDFSPDSWANIKGNIAGPGPFIKGIKLFSVAILSVVLFSLPSEFGVEEKIAFHENELLWKNEKVSVDGYKSNMVSKSKEMPDARLNVVEQLHETGKLKSNEIQQLDSNKDHDRGKVGEGLTNDQDLASIQSQRRDVMPKSLHLTLLYVGHKPEPLSFSSFEVEKQEKPFSTLKKNSNPWYLQAYVAPLFSYGNFSSNQADPILITGIEPYRRFSRERMGFSAHLGVEKMLNEKISLYGGISYQMINYQTSFNYQSVVPDSVTTTITPDNQLVVNPYFETRQAKTQNIYHLVGIDFGAKYIISARKVKNYLKADAGARIIPLAVFKVDGKTKNLHKQDLGNAGNFTVSLAYGMEYKIGERFGFRVEPGLVGYLNPLQSESGKFSLHLYSFQLNTGLSYRLTSKKWSF